MVNVRYFEVFLKFKIERAVINEWYVGSFQKVNQGKEGKVNRLSMIIKAKMFDWWNDWDCGAYPAKLAYAPTAQNLTEDKFTSYFMTNYFFHIRLT